MPPDEATQDIEAEAWQRFTETRDVELRNRLVEHHLPLARMLAATLYARRGALALDFGDYLQFATIGLVEAVDRYDPQHGASFATFASLRIRGSILNNLEALSERYQQLSLRKRLHAERFESLRRPAAGSGRKRDAFAALAEIAVGLALAHMLEGSGMLAPDSNQSPAYQQEFYDTTQERQMREALALLVQALPEQERRVVRYHYYQNLGFVEIAGLLGVTRGRVSQIHRQALLLLKEARHGPQGLDREA
jgi:RNA polymerase sigma factor FliA